MRETQAPTGATDPAGPDAAGPTGAGRVLVVVGIVLLAANLRPAAVSVGPVLAEIRSGLGMSRTAAGVLTSLPVVAFAAFGALAPRLTRRLGVHRTTLAALVAVLAGLVARSQAEGTVVFLVLSLVALAGMATANVVLPTLVRLHFPRQVALLTAVYSTALAVGLTGASVLTVPIAQQAGDWRVGLLAWAALALVAVLPWLVLVVRDRPSPAAGRPTPITLGAVARTRLGWLMAAVFGLQALHAYSIFGWTAEIYRDAGFSASTAGLLLGVVTAMSIPLSFVVPRLAGAFADLRWLVLGLVACYPLGYLGLAFTPPGSALGWAVAWAVLLGAACAMFPLALGLIGLRARTAEGTSALSAFTQSVGYLLAVIGPFGVGLLHDLAGDWTPPLVALAVLAVPLALAGLRVARPRYVEDELAAADARHH